MGTEQTREKWILLPLLWDGHTGPVPAPTVTQGIICDMEGHAPCVVELTGEDAESFSSAGLSIPEDLLLEVLHVIFV